MKYLELDSIFNYGIYEGRTLKDVWFGSEANEKEVFENYMKDMFLNTSLPSNRPIVPIVGSKYTDDDQKIFGPCLKTVRSSLCLPEISNQRIDYNFTSSDYSLDVIKCHQRILDILLNGDFSEFQRNYYDTRGRLVDEVKDTAIPQSARDLLYMLPNANYVLHQIDNNIICVKPDLLEQLLDSRIEYPHKLTLEHFDDYSVYDIEHSVFIYSKYEDILQTNLNNIFKYEQIENRKRRRYVDDSSWYDDDHHREFDPYSKGRACPACQEVECRCSDPFWA